MFDTPNIKSAFETFGKEVIQNARANLTRKDKNVSKELYNGMEYNYEGYKGGFRFTISMPQYGMYQDEGVKGKTSIYIKSKDSPFSYKNKFPPRAPIDRWVVRKGLRGARNAQGQFIPRKSMVFLIQRSIFQKGIEASNWFTQAFENKFKRLQPKLEDAFKLDAERFLNFVKKEVFA